MQSVKLTRTNRNAPPPEDYKVGTTVKLLLDWNDYSRDLMPLIGRIEVINTEDLRGGYPFLTVRYRSHPNPRYQRYFDGVIKAESWAYDFEIVTPTNEEAVFLLKKI